MRQRQRRVKPGDLQLHKLSASSLGRFSYSCIGECIVLSS
ncbi:hypothetical protein TSMEX_002936 [Taenia solium]|eukprot:TsM_000405400 transcript=TsM_000405400 gene=TsM_000405400